MFQTSVNVFILLNIEEDILKNECNQTVDGPLPIDLCSSFWLQTFFKISSFMINRRKKLIHVWVNNDRIFIFGEQSI